MKTAEEYLDELMKDNEKLSCVMAMKHYANYKLDLASGNAKAYSELDFGIILVDKKSILQFKDKL